MRILHLSQFHAPVIGGEERHVVSLSEGLAARGHEVTVATLAHPDRPPALVRNGVAVRSLTGLAQRGGFLFSEAERRHAPPFPDPELTLRLAALVREVRPDVVHGHNWMLHAYLPLKRRAGPRFVVTLHDYSLVCARKNMLRFGQEPCTGPSARRCLPCAADHFGAVVGGVTCAGNCLSSLYERRAVDRFVAVSRAVAETCGLPGGRVPYDVLPTFIPDEVARLDPAPDPLLAGLPPDGYLLFVGDLTRGKGVHVLLDAYRRLGDAPPLVLIGRRCPDTPTDLPDNVRLFESWPHAAVMHAWSRCLFGIAPSVWAEACGTIVMEGHAVGRPMIATDTGGLRDLVAPGETGLLVPPGDAEALAGAMRALIDDPARREAMAAASPARAKLFMASTLVPRIERVYADAIAGAALSEPRLPPRPPGGRVMSDIAHTLSVVICCYSDRRFDDLREAVLSVRGQLGPGDELVVVVDHNPSLLQRVRAAFPGLRAIENDGPRGLSGARNAGIEAARGDVLVFLDDDATATSGMLDGLRAAAMRPGSLGAVARIVPVWLGAEPRWFPPEFLWAVGCTYEGLRPGPVRNLIGAAMAVRRGVFEAVGGFDAGLGRTHAGLPLGCEETELCIRAGRAHPGGQFHYVPEAVCSHKVPPGRASPRYLAARCYAEGLSKARLGAIARGREALSSERAYVARTLPLGVARGLRDAVRGGDGAGALRAGCIALGLASTVAGYAVGRARLVLVPGRRAPAIGPAAGDTPTNGGGA